MIALTHVGTYHRDAATGPPPALAQRLSRRQCEVAVLVADGLSNKQIAGALGLTSSTVRIYIDRIKKKMALNESLNTRVLITREVILAWSEAV